MKKIFIAVIIAISLILFKFGLTFTINEIIINHYHSNKYDSTLVNTLYILNFNEPYIAYYNHGNLLYRLEKFDEAITKYELALKKHPKNDRVCDIRINLSLSYIKTVNEEKKEEALTILSKAKNVLYEDNCASSNDESGKSENAENLETEINKLEKQIKEANGDDNNNSNSNNNSNNNNESPNVEEELKEQRKQNQQNREEERNYYAQLDGNTYYTKKYW